MPESASRGVSDPGGVCSRGVSARGEGGLLQGGGCLLQGCLLWGVVCSWGVSAWGGVVVSQYALRQTSPPRWTESQTPVKTLPWPNFVAAGKKLNSGLS